MMRVRHVEYFVEYFVSYLDRTSQTDAQRITVSAELRVTLRSHVKAGGSHECMLYERTSFIVFCSLVSAFFTLLLRVRT